MFYWFEHSGDTSNASLGSHTLVIADHNAAFKPNARSSVRFSQSSDTVKDDTIDRWRTQAQWHTHAVELASWDYRTLSTRMVGEHSSGADNTPTLISQDTPGAYAYESATQGQRLALNHLQALRVPAHTLTAAGSVRAFCPGSTFTLSGYTSELADAYVLLQVIHHARNNLSADLKAQASLLAKSASSPLQIRADSYTFLSSPMPCMHCQWRPLPEDFPHA